MDLIEEEENEIFGNEENLDLPNEGIETIQVDEDENDDKEEDKDENDKKPVKPKRIIKNPRVVLNAELLKGPKGLGNLDKCFERVQFKGKGYEEQDLNVLLKTYEYWCHRMFPKFPFKDAVAKIETLGSKGPIQTHLKKVRSGMIEDDTVGGLPEFNSEDEEDNDTPPSNSVQSTSQTIAPDIPIQLTEEQLETIRINREKAEKLRQERLRRIREKASLNLPEKTVPLTPEVDGHQNNCVPSKSTDVTSDNNCALEQDSSTNLNTQEGLRNGKSINTESESDDELKSVKKSTKNVFHNDDEDEEEQIGRVGEETIAEVEEQNYEEDRIIDDKKEESTSTSLSRNVSEDIAEQMEVDG